MLEVGGSIPSPPTSIHFELRSRGFYQTRLDSCARGPLSPATVQSYVRVVNQMLVWARDPESGVEDDVPDGKVRLPKASVGP